MATFTDIYTDAFEKIHYYAPGDIIDDVDAEMALRVGNDLLDGWSNQSLSCFAILTQSVLMVPGIGQYSIGPGGTIDAARPLRLIGGPGGAYSMDTNGNRYSMDVVPEDQWNIVTSNTLVNANVPNYLWYDPQYPLGFINLWPVPNIGWTAYWTSYAQLTDFSSITGPFSFPPGYKKAIQDNLAVQLWPYCFRNKPVDPLLLKMAGDSLGDIKRTNIRENIAVYDAALVISGRSFYNIQTDSGG